MPSAPVLENLKKLAHRGTIRFGCLQLFEQQLFLSLPVQPLLARKHARLAQQRIELSGQNDLLSARSFHHSDIEQPFDAGFETLGMRFIAVNVVYGKEVVRREPSKLLITDLFQESQQARIADFAWQAEIDAVRIGIEGIR